MAKLVYFSPEAGSTDLGGRLNFYKFETEHIDEYINFMQVLKKRYEVHAKHTKDIPELCVVATGGGAFRFYDRIRQALGLEVQREDEMECLIIGTNPFNYGGIVFVNPSTRYTMPV